MRRIGPIALFLLMPSLILFLNGEAHCASTIVTQTEPAFLRTLSSLSSSSNTVTQVGISSQTVQTRTVSNTVSTLMDNPALVGRTAFCIQNTDSSAILWCDPNTAANALTSGVKIISGSSYCPNMKDVLSNGTAFHIYCISDTSSTKAAVLQAY